MGFERIWHTSYPANVPVEIEFERITLPEVLSRTAGRYPNVTALMYMGKKIAYRELDSLVNRFARALKDLGIRKGDKVAMLLPNIPEVVIGNYATYRIGAVTAMNNPLYTERELEHQLNEADAVCLVTLDLLLPRIMKIKDKTKIKTIIACHINDYLPFPLKQLFPILKKNMYRKITPQDGVYEFMKLIRKYPGDKMKNEARWDEIGTLMFTGGTTGISKAAMISHANMSVNVQQLRKWVWDLEDGKERTLAIFPFFHSAGFTGIQNLGLLSGATIILIPRPDPTIIVQQIKRFKPTLVPGVPTIFVGLLNSPQFRSLDLRFIKGFVAGAAPLAVNTIQELKDLTGGGITNIYGLTEISPMGTATPWRGKEKPGTVGVPLPSTDLKIVDIETGTKEMPIGEPGEVIFSGPQVMQGYYKRPQETAAVLKDGWLYTGDIGFLDEDGFLTIVDRKKDMIIASGYNIYPKEIDEILFEHSKILEACAVGIPDPYRGETVKAFIVVKPGETLTAEEVIQYCKEHLAAYKVPKQVGFLETLPKSAVGKILRRELREMELASHKE